MATATSFTNPARQQQAKRLNLKYNTFSRVILRDTAAYVLGRGKDCDMVVNGDLTSRYHSKIEHRRGKFVIIDQSTNGTFVKTQDGQDYFLRREELALVGKGVISLGRKIDADNQDLIEYSSD